jgi:hypothetical protein
MADIAFGNLPPYNFWTHAICPRRHVLRWAHLLILRDWPALNHLLGSIFDFDRSTRCFPLSVRASFNKLRLCCFQISSRWRWGHPLSNFVLIYLRTRGVAHGRLSSYGALVVVVNFNTPARWRS